MNIPAVARIRTRASFRIQGQCRRGAVSRRHIPPTLGGVDVPTLLDGATFQVQFNGKTQIRLVDAGGPGRDPVVRAVDIRASNGVAHAIDRVLIPG